MLDRIRRFFAPPIFEDEEKTRVARLLYVVLLTILVAAVVVVAVTLAFGGLSAVPKYAVTLLTGTVMVLISFVFLLIVRRGYLRPVSALLLFLMWALINVWVVGIAGISSDSSPLIYALIIVLAGLLLGGRGAVILTLASLLSVVAAYYAELSGWLVIREHGFSPADLVFTALPLLLTGLLLRYAVNSLVQAMQRARINEQAQREANRELEAIRATLEQRVAERTADLERRSMQLQAVVEVGRAATSTLDPESLVWQVVELIQERFGLYHVGLFQIDETGRWAGYRAGAGEAGRQLAREGFRLEVGGPSMVGWCTLNARSRVAQEVSREPMRLDHPLLPAVRSEAALPLIARGQVIGALSVQSDRPAAFDPGTVAALETTADQVAVALDNARLYRQSQEALEATRRAYGELSRQAWSERIRGRADWGYLYTGQQVSPTTGEWRPEMLHALQTGQVVSGDGAGEPTLAIPLRVRDQVIGALGFYRAPTAGSGGWTAEERELLETLVAQLGVALESAQLFEETQRRAAQDRLLGEVTSRMRETLDMDLVLQTAIREIGEALGLAEVEVRMAGGPATRPSVPARPAGGNGRGGEEEMRRL